MQTRTGPRGNCLAACIASLAGCDLDIVDFSCADHPDPGAWIAAAEWVCAAVGLGYVLGRPMGAPYIAHGPSPRGYEHAVILGPAGELLHDPHPDGGKILRVAYRSYLVAA